MQQQHKEIMDALFPKKGYSTIEARESAALKIQQFLRRQRESLASSTLKSFAATVATKPITEVRTIVAIARQAGRGVVSVRYNGLVGRLVRDVMAVPDSPRASHASTWRDRMFSCEDGCYWVPFFLEPHGKNEGPCLGSWKNWHCTAVVDSVKAGYRCSSCLCCVCWDCILRDNTKVSRRSQ